MQIPVLVEPIATGFRASTGSPLDLTAEGASADDALATLKKNLTTRLQSGAKLRSLRVLDVDSMLAAGRSLAANPLFDDWVAAVEEYRRIHNTVPDE